jgi:hypothetical protein
MQVRLTDLARGAMLVLLVVGMSMPAVGYADDDDDKRGRKEEEQSDAFRSARDDRQVKGQVLEINSLKNPPELSIANMDGVVKVRMLTTDLISKNAVRLGDHVTLIGEKISELEFDCQDMSVDAHLGNDLDD